MTTRSKKTTDTSEPILKRLGRLTKSRTTRRLVTAFLVLLFIVLVINVNQ